MGYENRDYYRDSPEYGGTGDGGSDLSASIIGRLLIINILVYVLQILLVRDGNAQMPASYLEEWFALDPSLVRQGQVWRLLSYAFLHSRFSPWHIVMNLYFLWILGRELERMYGSREILSFFLTGAFLGGLAQFVLQAGKGIPGQVMGSSGGVMAIFMLYVMHFPRRQFMILLILPVEARFLLAFDLILELHPLLLQLSGFPYQDQVAHAAHVGGFVFGYFYYRGHWRLGGLLGSSLEWISLNRWRRWWNRPRLRVVRAEPMTSRSGASDEDRIDELLRKIKEHGESSLTDAERRFLNEASRRARERRNQ